MLAELYASLNSTDLFLTAEQFQPFPKAGDREAWKQVSAEAREQWLGLAELHLGYNWPAIKMEYYLELKRSGNIQLYMNDQWERRSILGAFVLAECLEDKGRFMDQIVNGIFAICEETSWMAPLTNTYLQKVNKTECLPAAEDHIVDLSSGETAALLTWTYYLLIERFNSFSLRVGQRIQREVHERVIIPYLEKDDYWWMGFLAGTRVNNWNPWCNGNVLMSLLVLEPNLQVREAGIKKIMQSLDVFIATHPADGCCDEGPMYWGRSGGSLYDCLELLDLASSHKINIYQEPLVQDIGRYLYRVHIHGDYCVNFADGDAKAGMTGDVVFGYGSSIGDVQLMQLGASISRQPIDIYNWFSLYRYTRDLFQEQERKQYAEKAPYVRDAWMAHSQVMTAREAQGSEKGLYLAAKGGHNLESHNHNDVGSFVIYADGFPVLIDLGTEEYTFKTFSPQRFELWYLQSAYHNLPTVRGVMQQDGRDFRASHVNYKQSDEVVELQLNLADAYPEAAGIVEWNRTLRLVRGNESAVELIDQYVLKEPTGDAYWSLVTVCEPLFMQNGSFTLEYAPKKKVSIEYDGELLRLESEKIELADKRLQSQWGSQVYRILLKLKAPGIQGVSQIRVVIDKEV